MRSKIYNHICKFLLPCTVFSVLTGFISAIIITLFKIVAEWAVHISIASYEAVRAKPIWIPVLVIAAALLGLATSFIITVYDIQSLFLQMR